MYKLHHWDCDSDTSDPGWPRNYITYDYRTDCSACHQPNGFLRIFQHLFGGPVTRCRHHQGRSDKWFHHHGWDSDVKGIARRKGCKNNEHYALAFHPSVDVSELPDEYEWNGLKWRTKLPEKCHSRTPRHFQPSHTAYYYPEDPLDDPEYEPIPAADNRLYLITDKDQRRPRYTDGRHIWESTPRKDLVYRGSYDRYHMDKHRPTRFSDPRFGRKRSAIAAANQRIQERKPREERGRMKQSTILVPRSDRHTHARPHMTKRTTRRREYRSPTVEDAPASSSTSSSSSANTSSRSHRSAVQSRSGGSGGSRTGNGGGSNQGAGSQVPEIIVLNEAVPAQE
ncbi:hypothetical protein GGR57DRAFT_515698 [Xylariaceae sp. FL1272]|nr:hypothetical protein GGR57DRAFT_515698 [Xylariaceae sp. FL1272]